MVFNESVEKKKTSEALWRIQPLLRAYFVVELTLFCWESKMYVLKW